MKKKNDIMTQALKAVRKLNREEEIRRFGKSICYAKVVPSKKRYTRKQKHKGKDGDATE